MQQIIFFILVFLVICQFLLNLWLINTLKILCVDDYDDIRESIHKLIEADFRSTDQISKIKKEIDLFKSEIRHKIDK